MIKSNKRVKIIHDSGRIKEVLSHIAYNSKLMNGSGWQIMESEVKELEPLNESIVVTGVSDPVDNSDCDLSVFEGKNLKITVSMIESGDYDNCLQELYDYECNNANRIGAKKAIEERQKNK